MIGPTLINKRINLAGNAGTITKVDKGLATVRLDNYATLSLVLQTVAAKLPYLYSRKDF